MIINQKMIDKVEEKQNSDQPKHKQEGQHANPNPPSSSSSSPSHEFSFTISLDLHHPPDKSKTTPPSSSAADLSPADEIFFHGHLLPLHLLSHLPVSPRSSSNSLDTFTLPITDPLQPQHHPNTTTSGGEIKEGTTKSNSFSLFNLPKWKKEYVERENRHQKKLSDVLKKYMRKFMPLLSFRGRKSSKSYSFSGNSTSRLGNNKQEVRVRRGGFSAPASMRASPASSGINLVATGSGHSSTSESSMEELQAAIQAAIAHCKNSIAMEDKKIKCQD